MTIRKKRLWIFIGVMVVIIALIPRLFGPKPEGAGAAKAGDRKKNARPVSVSVYIVKPQPIQDKIVSTGTVVANKEVQLRSEASGRIVGVYFKEGFAVTKGQVLLKLNDADLQATYAKTLATLSLVQEREKRQKLLLDKEVGSREEYETAARDLASAQADANLAKAQIDKTNLVAPFDGIIGIRSVDEGGYVTTGAIVANLISRKPVKIEFSVPERFSGAVSNGSALTFTVESSPVTYEATVTAVEPRIDEATRTMRVQATCTNVDNRVVPGSFAKVEMVVGTNAAALLVPSEALVPDAQGYKVFVKKDTAAVAVAVVPGVRKESTVEIVNGLKDGDSVIVSGILSLRPGMKVEVRKE